MDFGFSNTGLDFAGEDVQDRGPPQLAGVKRLNDRGHVCLAHPQTTDPRRVQAPSQEEIGGGAGGAGEQGKAGGQGG